MAQGGDGSRDDAAGLVADDHGPGASREGLERRALIGKGDLGRAASLRTQPHCRRSGHGQPRDRSWVQGEQGGGVLQIRTMPAAAACRASPDRSAVERRGCGGMEPSRRRTRSMRSAASPTASALTVPRATASSRCSPRKEAGPGISRSSPAPSSGRTARPEPVGHHCTLETPLLLEHSRRGGPDSHCKTSRGVLLYAAITMQTPASRTAASNGAR